MFVDAEECDRGDPAIGAADRTQRPHERGEFAGRGANGEPHVIHGAARGTGERVLGGFEILEQGAQRNGARCRRRHAEEGARGVVHPQDLAARAGEQRNAVARRENALRGVGHRLVAAGRGGTQSVRGIAPHRPAFLEGKGLRPPGAGHHVSPTTPGVFSWGESEKQERTKNGGAGKAKPAWT